MAGEVFIFGAGGSGGAGGSELTVVGGTTRPAKVAQNTVWVNTDADITSLVFSSEEPNTYDFKCDKLNGGADDAHGILVPFRLKEGDIINFTIPVTTTGVFEAVRFKDCIGKQYCIRHENGTAVSEWTAGTKIGVRISNTAHQIGSWGNDGSAYIIKWGSYYHEEGMVWITIGDSGSVKMSSPVGGDWITVYPISATQVIGGAWVDKTAKSYQDGAWVSWIRYLYNAGDECIDITGGWEAWTTTAKVTKEADCISVYCTSDPGNNHGFACGTVNPIDLSSVKEIQFKATATDSSYTALYGLGVCKTKNSSDKVAYKACIGSTKNNVLTLDVSSLTGEYFICITSGTTTANNATKLYECKLV